jgi:putative hydrolase of the HAD superfamily
MFKYLILDLDETLYPRGTGLMTEIGQRILLYMTRRMGFAPDKAAALKKDFFVQYGTTLRGLQLEYHVDPDDYLQFVHDVPLENYIAPDLALDAMLSRIRLDKVIFTNADAAHARRVMERLGVAHHFPTVVDIHAVEFYCKPNPQAYQRILDVISVPGSVCIMVEDSARNLRPARELYGMTTILVDGEKADGVDYAIGDLMELEGLVHRLMAGKG